MFRNASDFRSLSSIPIITQFEIVVLKLLAPDPRKYILYLKINSQFSSFANDMYVLNVLNKVYLK